MLGPRHETTLRLGDRLFVRNANGNVRELRGYLHRRALTEERARELEAEGHVVKPDGHGKLRRVVGSPAPRGILELPTIKTLVEAGMLVVACGGGGAPVYEHPTLGWEGIDR